MRFTENEVREALKAIHQCEPTFGQIRTAERFLEELGADVGAEVVWAGLDTQGDESRLRLDGRLEYDAGAGWDEYHIGLAVPGLAKSLRRSVKSLERIWNLEAKGPGERRATAGNALREMRRMGTKTDGVF